MKVIGNGYNWYYCDGKTIEHQPDETAYLLYIFNTPAILRVREETYQVDYGNVLLLPPGEAHEISSVTDNFMVDWIEFHADSNDVRLLESLDIPFGQIVTIRNANMLAGVVMNCCFIFGLDNGIHTQTLQQLLLAIFYTIHSLIKDSEGAAAFRLKHPEIVELRRKLYEEPQRDWNMKMMCQFTHCSGSKLQKLYKQFYTVTCIEDVMISRILCAKNLLRSTALSISEIAEQCGFHSYEHFFRTFRKQAGCTPKEFRNGTY